MPSWELVKKVAEATLEVAVRSDVTRQEMDSVVRLADSARRTRLREIGDEVRRRLAAQWEMGGGDKDAVKLGQSSARCLQVLASKGDDRARRLLPYVTVAWAAHGQLDDLGDEFISCTFAEHVEIGRTMSVRRGCLAGLGEQVEFLRDVGRACLMGIEHPAWPQQPSEGTEALFVVQEGQCVLLPSRGWHLVKLKKVRRTRASAQLVKRVDREGDWDGRIGCEFNYPLSCLVGARSAEVVSVNLRTLQ